MKTFLIMCISLFFSNFLLSQQSELEKSKMVDFVSKTGITIKFEDYELPNIQLSYNTAESNIRKISAANEQRYFLQLSVKSKYDTKVASIAYQDLIEVRKALSSLKLQSENDSDTNSDYLQNKFITDDGFQVGYYLSKGKIVWFMQLKNYGSDSTVYFKDYESLDNALSEGQQKIEELR